MSAFSCARAALIYDVERMWDPAQYTRFRDERQRPFFELLARVRHLDPKRIVDLGCGTGSLTEVLADMWPDAEVVGVDRSAEMLEHAHSLDHPHVIFRQQDIVEFQPNGEDLTISNAALHWVPDHENLVLRIAKALKPGATFAFQVPKNFDAPSHVLLRKLCSKPEWRSQLGDPRRQASAHSGVEYARSLLKLGLAVDAWETTYVQLLPGEDAVFEWLAGTTLRPVFAGLNAEQQTRFSSELKTMLAEAYPPEAYGTVYEFRRVFVVATAPERPDEEKRAVARAEAPLAAAKEGDEVGV
jgi:trans-aconitate 2-methyltransferase